MTKIKAKVITTVAAWPEALLAMKFQLNKHLKEPFEFIAFIDTPTTPGPYNLWDSGLRNFAESIAQEVCDEYFLVPEQLHNDRSVQFPTTRERKKNNANTRAADTLQYAWNQVIRDSTGPVLILDNDMFPIADFDTSQVLASNPIGGIFSTSPAKNRKSNVNWIWSGLLFMDPSKMPHKELWSFDCGKVNNVPVDVSGQTHVWLKAVKKLGIEPKWLSHLSSLKWGMNELDIQISRKVLDFIIHDDRNLDKKFYTELYDYKFLHFRAGSNWKKEPSEIVRIRNQNFLNALSELN